MGLRLQTGAQYSAVRITRASMEMCSVFVDALHVVLARCSISEVRGVFPFTQVTRYCWNDSVLFSFTPRYVREDWGCSRTPSTMMLISLVASLLLRWNTVEMVFKHSAQVLREALFYFPGWLAEQDCEVICIAVLTICFNG